MRGELVVCLPELPSGNFLSPLLSPNATAATGPDASENVCKRLEIGRAHV